VAPPVPRTCQPHGRCAHVQWVVLRITARTGASQCVYLLVGRLNETAVCMGETRNAYRILVGRCKNKRSLEITLKWEGWRRI
jgi:hypothetical protein